MSSRSVCLRQFARFCAAIFGGGFLAFFSPSLHGQNDEAVAIDRQIQQHFAKKEFAPAIPLLERLLAIREQTFGADDARTNETVGALAYFHDQLGQRTQAIPYREREVTWRRQHAPDQISTGRALNNLGLAYAEAGMFAKAEPIYREALKLYGQIKDSDGDAVTTERNLAIMFGQADRHADAVPEWKRLVALLALTRGPRDPDTISARLELLRSLGRAGRVEEAQHYAETLQKEGVTGTANDNTVSPELNTLMGEADRYFSHGQFADARPILEKLLAGEKRAFGEHDVRLIIPLANLGLIHMKLGDDPRAAALYEEGLALAREIRGPKDPLTAQLMNNLALTYAESGATGKALSMYQECLTIREASGNGQAIAETLNNLATLYQNIGDLATAEPLYERALGLYRQALGENNPLVARVLANLGMVHYYAHDLDKAATMQQRAIDVYEKSIGPEHPDIAEALNNLALTYSDMGRLRDAVPLYERSLKIHETALGSAHPFTITSLSNLGTLWMQLGDDAKAEPLLSRAAEESKRISPGSAGTAVYLNNLANLYAATGRADKAIACWRKAADNHLRAVGMNHPYTQRILTNLGKALIEQGQTAEALDIALKARDAGFQALSNVLAFAPEQERLAYHASENPYALLAALGRDQDLGLTVLRHKGVVLDSILEDRVVSDATGTSEQKEKVDRLYHLQEQISDMTRRGETGAKVERLQEEAGQIEGELARRFLQGASAREAAKISVEMVQQHLPAEGMLIEYVRYGYLTDGTLIDHYAAALFAPTGDCRWIDLGAADEIDRHIALYRKSARGDTDEPTLTTALHTLYADLWQPLAGHLQAHRIIISPDSNLNFVSFATLLTADNRFLIDDHVISYVSTGRDLLREPKASRAGAAIFFGNPDFTGEARTTDSPAPPVATRAGLADTRRSMSSLRLSPLPGTAAECRALEAQARERGLATQIYLGANASEAQLRAVAGPRILHFATHGFFLPENAVTPHAPDSIRELTGLLGATPGGSSSPTAIADPMGRSGLALAGAQRTLEAWARAEVPALENDGIVTAGEVGGLNLQGTWLVTLSACDTGTGEARAGEGVMGLRRGFVQAGAQNLLMTLWPVSDETTVDIMKDFYGRALNTHNASQALADVQRDWLIKLRKEKGLLPAVTLAGPFIMSSQGNSH